MTELNLEKEILKDLSKEVADSIDSSLLYHIMSKYWEEQGWTKVTLSKLQDNNHAVDITYWLQENGFFDTVNYYREGREFLFERAEDATAFILRWA